jgi:hypothetical protein
MYHAWGRRGIHMEFLWEGQKERDLYEDIDIGGRIRLKGVWTDMAQAREQRRALVKIVINHWVP